MRLLYLYPEEWTGHRAREVHTLSTCLALAKAGAEVTLLTAGGEAELMSHAQEVAGSEISANLHLVTLRRSWGPVRSARIFSYYFLRWLATQPRFDRAYCIHLKAGALLRRTRLPYLYEAHEIFAETPQRTPTRQLQLSRLEQSVLSEAATRIATSAPLAEGLAQYYGLKNDFLIIPNAGQPALMQSIGKAAGPLVYFGSIADWKGLKFPLQAAHQLGLPLRVVGGTEAEWTQLSAGEDWPRVTWKPRVSLQQVDTVLRGARAGIIPTQTTSPSGHYSCPMKLFDYARCGLPVVSTPLLSYASLQLGPWCHLVSEPTVAGWRDALHQFSFEPDQAEAARAWAETHTWARRAQEILPLLVS